MSYKFFPFLKNRTCSFNRNKHVLPKTSCAIYNSNNKSLRESEYKIILCSSPKKIIYMVTKNKLFAESSYLFKNCEKHIIIFSCLVDKKWKILKWKTFATDDTTQSNMQSILHLNWSTVKFSQFFRKKAHFVWDSLLEGR